MTSIDIVRFIASAISSLPFNFENEPLLLIFDACPARILWIIIDNAEMHVSVT